MPRKDAAKAEGMYYFRDMQPPPAFVPLGLALAHNHVMHRPTLVTA